MVVMPRSAASLKTECVTAVAETRLQMWLDEDFADAQAVEVIVMPNVRDQACVRHHGTDAVAAGCLCQRGSRRRV